ncbi:molybdopterin-dependent oxidoreductase [Actinomycetospora sp. OC33-EN08]|uniref:Molybdopterin-dependent oxidoreductase n=1 Tax=Actinomycetospora aurantiaca TaxID=3129233 RepID=A0ABU8MLJ4_9PSEU
MRATMDPVGAVRRLVPPERLTERVTGPDDAFVIAHFGLARPEPDRPVVVNGLVEREVTLHPDEVRALPAHRVESVHECFGNPLTPGERVRRVANLVWTGARLRDVLDLAGVRPEATTLWARGADHGEFGGVASPDYLKDLPLDDVGDRALVAYSCHDAPMTSERGGPLRLVVPGYFGTNSVKWLTDLTLADHRPEHLFTTRLYLRPGPDGRSVPVRELDVSSVVTGVSDGEARGWAWSSTPVVEVVVEADGEPVPAELEAARGRAWQGFRARVGAARTVTARATDAAGRTQPLSGARNAVR